MKSLKELFLLLSLAFLVRIPWLVMVPQVEAPDESTHFWVIQFIVQHLCLPDYQSVINGGAQAVYASLPQFGYLPHVLLLKCLGGFVLPEHALYLARLGSLCMGLIVVGVAYFIGRLLFLPNHIAALALPLMIIFHPQFVFVGCYVNNDATTAALAALILIFLIVAIKKGLNFSLVCFLSLCFSLLILAKYSGYCVLLTSAVFIPIIIYLHRKRLKGQLALAASMGLITLFLTLWWFVRNYFQFAGDITGVKTMNDIWQLTYHKHLIAFDSPLAPLVNTRFWRMLFFSFWGWFGYMTRSLPRVLYYGYLSFIIVSAAQFISNIIDKQQKGKLNLLPHLKTLLTLDLDFPVSAAGSGIVWIRSWTWLLLITCFVLNFISCMYGCYSGVAGPQGRYLFPSEIAIMALLLGGLASKRDKWSEYSIMALVAFNFVVYCYSTYYLSDIYRHF